MAVFRRNPGTFGFPDDGVVAGEGGEGRELCRTIGHGHWGACFRDVMRKVYDLVVFMICAVIRVHFGCSLSGKVIRP